MIRKNTMGSNDAKLLRIYGSLLVFLAVLDMIFMVLDVFESGHLLKGLSGGQLAFIAVLYAASVCVVILKLWMGRQGIRYAKGQGTGTGHITVAKIALVLLGIFVAVDVAEMIAGNAKLTDVLDDMISLCIAYEYLRTAKACL